ncbi:MAG TPA: ATP synthase subunit I [Patescibacteria group bacterium]|nr:ATP synthase subunit I [Patescibacteria group bacterium]
MFNYSDYEIKNIYAKCIKYLLVTAVLLFCLFIKNISYALGFVLGGLVCLVNFSLMVKSIQDIFVSTTFSKAFFSGLFSIRLIITLIVLWFAIKLDSINLFTTVLGMLSMKTVIIIDEVIQNIKSIGNSE